MRGQSKEFVLTGNTLVLLHFGTPGPCSQKPIASQKIPHFLSVLVHAKDAEILQLSGMLLAQVADPNGCTSHPHEQDSDSPAFLVYPGNSSKKKNQLCSPHSEPIEAAKSNTQSKERRVLELL